MKTIIFIVILIYFDVLVYGQNWQIINNDLRSNAVSLSSSNTNLFIGIHFAEGGNHHIKVWDGNNLDSLECTGLASKMLYYNGYLYESACSGGIRRFNGINWETIGNTNENGIIFDFHFYNNEIYAVGSFDSINGISIHDIAKWDGNMWSSFDTTQFTGGGIRFCIHYNGEFYVGGVFSNWNSTLETLIKWNGISWENLNLNVIPGSFNLMTAEVYKNELYIGGYISTPNLGNGLLRYDGNSWKGVGGGIKRGSFPRVNAFHVLNNELFVGGVFDTVGYIRASMVASWNGNSWCSLSSNIDGPLFSLGNFRDSLIIGGNFKNIDGDSIINVGLWKGGTNYDTCTILSGINEFIENSTIILFPNPSSGLLKISSQNIQIKKIVVSDILGKQIFSKNIFNNETELNLFFLNKGLYFINIDTNSGHLIKKFIKE